MAGDILCGELQSTRASMTTLKLAAAPPAAPPSRLQQQFPSVNFSVFVLDLQPLCVLTLRRCFPCYYEGLWHEEGEVSRGVAITSSLDPPLS